MASHHPFVLLYLVATAATVFLIAGSAMGTANAFDALFLCSANKEHRQAQNSGDHRQYKKIDSLHSVTFSPVRRIPS